MCYFGLVRKGEGLDLGSKYPKDLWKANLEGDIQLHHRQTLLRAISRTGMHGAIKFGLGQKEMVNITAELLFAT